MLKANACVCLRYEILCFIVEGPVSLLFFSGRDSTLKFSCTFQIYCRKKCTLCGMSFFIKDTGIFLTTEFSLSVKIHGYMLNMLCLHIHNVSCQNKTRWNSRIALSLWSGGTHFLWNHYNSEYARLFQGFLA